MNSPIPSRRRSGVMRHFVFTVLLLVSPMSLIAQEAQLKVVAHIWGFDGRVQPGQFNPLSILLDNQTADPIDAKLTLQHIQGSLSPSGGVYVQDFFIASTARQWVQFYPYIPNSNSDQWRLSIEGLEESGSEKLQDFTQPRSAIKTAFEKVEQPPQAIIFDKAERVSSIPSTVKHFPENIFPPYATATVGLHTVFLDHVPDWEAPRRKAFLSWLKQGGRLHLLQDARGELPRFSGEMAVISKPFDRYTIGKGLVVRHAFQRDGVTKELVNQVTVVDVLQSPDEEFEKQLTEEMQAKNFGGGLTGDDLEASSIDDSIFRGMRELTMPEHAWPVIFLLALCYIGLMYPGCFILSQDTKRHFLTTYGAIIGLTVVFSALFMFIGRRGYGETTTLQTLGIARAENDTDWSVMQWNAFFVTSGDVYDAEATDQQSVFATSETTEEVSASMLAGKQGRISMRIPPYSSQTFVSRRQVKTLSWGLKIANFRAGATRLDQLSFRTGAGFPTGEDVEYYVLHGRNVYAMTHNAETRTLEQLGRRRPLAAFCRPVFSNQFANAWTQSATKPDTRTEQQKFFDDSLPSLAQRSLFDDLVHSPRRFVLPPGRIRLYVYAPIPEEMQIQLNSDAKRTGRMLFVKDINVAGD